jgi:hypothetical protein
LSVPVVAVTASEMLFTHADLKSGETVLIQCASGNVGGYAFRTVRAMPWDPDRHVSGEIMAKIAFALFMLSRAIAHRGSSEKEPF